MDEVIKKEYELSFLVKQPEAALEIEKALSGEQAEIFDGLQPKELRLAYPVKKNNSAYFGVYYFKAVPEAAAKIRKTLGLSPAVLRFLIIASPIKNIISGGPAKQVAPAAGPALEVPLPQVLTNEALEQKLEEILK